MVTTKITNPSLETQDTKVIVHERLGELEQKLSTLTNSPKPKTKKAQQKRQASILDLTRSIDNFKAYLSLSIDQRVTDGTQLGLITDLTLSPGGMPEVWVSWYNHVSIPEQPIRLKPEPFFEQLKVGDSVTINDQHAEAAQQTFEIKEFRGEGWILTTTNQLFHHDFIEKMTNIEEKNVSEVVDESVSEIVDETLEISEITAQEQLQSTTIVEVVQSSTLTDPDELTDEEARDRLHLEGQVELAFFSAGIALQELRDRRLYRSTHKTFEDYCQERFGYSRRKMDYLIAGSEVYQNLLAPSEMRTNCSQTDLPDDQSQMRTNGSQITESDNNLQMRTNCSQNADGETRTNCSQILPNREAQVRPLTKLEPDQQREAWALAVEQAGGKVPSGRIVKSIVDQIRERTPVPNPWRKGEVAMIMVKDNPELRGKGGCWAVITEVHNFSCTVRLWDGNYQVKPENLKELPYSNEQQEMVRKLFYRLSKITLDEVEKPMKDFLKGLGRLDRPWLSDYEEKVLTMLEEGK